MEVFKKKKELKPGDKISSVNQVLPQKEIAPDEAKTYTGPTTWEKPAQKEDLYFSSDLGETAVKGTPGASPALLVDINEQDEILILKTIVYLNWKKDLNKVVILFESGFYKTLSFDNHNAARNFVNTLVTRMHNYHAR